MRFTLLPNPGSRKLVALYYAVLMYTLGCLATGVAVTEYSYITMFGIFVGGNYGEHKTKNGT